jgi:hypothetical protein
MSLAMQDRRKLKRGDAFERALKEAFGDQTNLAKVEQARQLYARYRTDEMLERLRMAVGRKSDEIDKP